MSKALQKAWEKEKRIIAYRKMKPDVFRVSVRCPMCKSALDMRVSDDISHNYAYYCKSCDKHFYSYECKETAADFYEISFVTQTKEWYDKHYKDLDKLVPKYDACHLSCDEDTFAGCDTVFIDFGWEYPIDSIAVQKITDELLEMAGFNIDKINNY